MNDLRDDAVLTDASVLSTDEPPGDTLALNVIAAVFGDVRIVTDLDSGFASIQGAVE